MLRHIEPTPAHLVHYLSQKREVTPEMMLGTLVHARILEPHKPLPRIAIKPEKYPAPADCSAVKQKKAQPGDLLDWHGSSTYCKQWIKDQANAGNIVLSEAEAETLNRMVDGVAKHPRVIDILDGAQTEVSIFRQQGSLFRKHRLDIVTRYNFLADVKSTDDASPEAFAKNLVAKDWAAQAADYLDAWNQMNPDDPRVGFVFIVVERETGLTALYYLTERALDYGRTVNKRRLAIASECYATNSFPGFPEEIQAGDIEDWAARKAGL
jgi:exodeoxyribonuclease VIII